MWTTTRNILNDILIRHNDEVVAVLEANGTFKRYRRVRIPIYILRDINVPQQYIDEVRAQDTLYNSHRTGRTTRITNISPEGFNYNRTFGIELECYHPSNSNIKEDISEALNEKNIPCEILSYTHRVTNGWKITTDGSLNGEYTMELVSPVLKGGNGLNQIKIVTEVLQSLGVKVNKSCGTHIHHYAKDLRPRNIKMCYETYKANESLIDSIIVPSRRDNNCCWAKSLNNISYEAFRRSHGRRGRNGFRYYKLNAQCYPIYGTIEFRQHQGTLNFDKICNWIKLTQAILLYGTGETYENIQDMITRLSVEDNGFFANRQIALSE